MSPASAGVAQRTIIRRMPRSDRFSSPASGHRTSRSTSSGLGSAIQYGDLAPADWRRRRSGSRSQADDIRNRLGQPGGQEGVVARLLIEQVQRDEATVHVPAPELYHRRAGKLLGQQEADLGDGHRPAEVDLDPGW